MLAYNDYKHAVINQLTVNLKSHFKKTYSAKERSFENINAVKILLCLHYLSLSVISLSKMLPLLLKSSKALPYISGSCDRFRKQKLHQWPSGSASKIARQEVPVSNPGRDPQPRHSEFYVVFSKTRQNTS